MHKDNPLWQINLGLPEGFFSGFSAPEGHTDAEFLWRFLEDYLSKLGDEALRPALSYRGTPGETPPTGPRQRVILWRVASNLLRFSSHMCFIVVRSYLPALDAALSSGWLLPSCALSRAMLEHAVVGQHQSMLAALHAPWLLKQDKAMLLDHDPPREMFEDLWRVLDGTRFPWATRDELLAAKEAKAAEKQIAEADRQTNIVSILEKIEKTGLQPGLVHHYHLLCDCVHPSRGTRELLFTTTHMEGDRKVALGFSDRVPLAAFVDRVKRVVCPALVHTFNAVIAAFGEPLKVSQWLSKATTELCEEHSVSVY